MLTVIIILILGALLGKKAPEIKMKKIRIEPYKADPEAAERRKHLHQEVAQFLGKADIPKGVRISRYGSTDIVDLSCKGKLRRNKEKQIIEIFFPSINLALKPDKEEAIESDEEEISEAEPMDC